MRDNFTKHYVLDGHEPVEADLLTWARWLEGGPPIVARYATPDIIISTVFLGLDHNWSEIGPPILFETMIFGGEHDGWQTRCATWTEALQQHEEAKQLAFGLPMPSTTQQLPAPN